MSIESVATTQYTQEFSRYVFTGFLVVLSTIFSISLMRRRWLTIFGRNLTAMQHTDYADSLAELRSIRESGIRDSERVVELWYQISPFASKLGSEKWAIVEQVFIASLDAAADQLACDCLDQLRTQFKKSSRLKRLFGMYLERNGRFEDARVVYTQLLNDDATNVLARKRLIAILKAQRKRTEAIDELRQYLKTFMSDFEAWNELADLYLAEGDFKHAAFCMEELLLSNPHNHLYCQRYAEIKYTEGGTENMEIARAYFSYACQLNPDSLRSLYGLLLTCSSLDTQSSKSSWDSVTILCLKSNAETQNTDKSDPVTSEQRCPQLPINTRIPQQSGTRFPSHLSGSELNRQLVRWATTRIRHIYEVALIPTASCSLPVNSVAQAFRMLPQTYLSTDSKDVCNHVDDPVCKPLPNNLTAE